MVKKGMTLEQVKAAKPTGRLRGPCMRDDRSLTTGMFIEAAHKTVPRGATK